MSIRLDLDESLVQVAPTLDDVEAVLVVRTRLRSPFNEGADGIVRKITVREGRKTRTVLPRIDVGDHHETRIGANDAKGQPEYEARTVYRAGGAGSVFLTTDRRVRFALRWYGDNQRYLELRLRVFPTAEVVANRGMAPFGMSGGFNFLGRTQAGEWVEVHYDNLTHVGISMVVHPSTDDFSVWKKPPEEQAPLTDLTRFDRVLGDR